MRIKSGFARKRAHKKVLAQTKGFRMTKNRLYKVAKEALVHSGAYAYNGRKEKKQTFRRLWITRISGALKSLDMSYSRFIAVLKHEQIIIDRKILAEILQDSPETFAKIVADATKNKA